jgi:ABC-type transport system involved in multi-copper enzyme maturation permease subunit
VSGVVVVETVRRYLTSIGFWGFMAFIAIVSFGMSRFNMAASSWPSLVGLMAIIAGCAPIGPEFSSGTLQLILVKPVKRSAYLLSRVAGVVLVTWIAALIGFTAEVLGRALLADEVPLETLATALVNTSIEAVLTVALLTFLGSFTRAYFNVALYLVLQVALGMTIGFASVGRRWPELTEVLQHVMNNLFPEPPRSLDRQWLLLVLSNAAVALVLACLVFRRREVPYGAD